MTICSKHFFGGHGPVGHPGYAYERVFCMVECNRKSNQLHFFPVLVHNVFRGSPSLSRFVMLAYQPLLPLIARGSKKSCCEIYSC